MRNLVLPVILGLAGTAGGIGAGLALRPVPFTESGDAGPLAATVEAPAAAAGYGGRDHATAAEGLDYIKLNNQFVVPVVAGKQVNSLVVMSLSLEIGQGEREAVYAREPKLRDALLQVLFDHANMGGFDGTFTDGNTLDVLRAALTETARGILGDAVRNVLIVDIARQDM